MSRGLITVVPKPIERQAFQYTGHPQLIREAFPDLTFKIEPDGTLSIYNELHQAEYPIRLGDWIMYDPKSTGDYYPCANSVMKTKFDFI
jgi:hypothetical protein